LRGLLSGSIGDRMSSFDNFDRLAVGAVFIARDHETGERTRPNVLDGFGHRSCALTGAHNDRSAAWLRRQIARNDMRGMHGSNGLLKQTEEEFPWIDIHEA
jgi:hypothetical protein